MKLQIQAFRGIAPRVSPRYLPEGMSQIAIDAETAGQDFRPLSDVGDAVATLTHGGNIQTIYRFGQDLDSESQHWFAWDSDVDVCRGQIAGDPAEWTFYTGDGVPKATTNSIALGYRPPANWRRLGIPAPPVKLAGSSDEPQVDDDDPEADSDDPITTESRAYFYTWVSTLDGLTMESPPSPVSDIVDSYNNSPVELTGFQSSPGVSGVVVTGIRIYRSLGGVYLFVDEVAPATSRYVDTKLADQLGEAMLSLVWQQAPDDLRGLTNLPNGIMAGFIGRDLWLCEPYKPYMWPIEYNQTIDAPIVGLGRMDTTLAVLTKGNPYFLQGAHPDSMVLVKSDIEQSCVSKRSIVSLDGAVFYASPDGLVRLSPQGSGLVTQSVMAAAQWRDLNPETIRAYGHDSQYIAFCEDEYGVLSGFVYDTRTQQFWLMREGFQAAYTDLRNDTLYVVDYAKRVVPWNRGSALLAYYHSKIFTLPQPTTFSAAQVEAENYPVVFELLADGALHHWQYVDSRAPFRLPVGQYRDWEILIASTHRVYNVVIAQSITELADG